MSTTLMVTHDHVQLKTCQIIVSNETCQDVACRIMLVQSCWKPMMSNSHVCAEVLSVYQCYATHSEVLCLRCFMLDRFAYLHLDRITL
ncbi:hypothetical protein M438DRAFT_91640 [Aureobasidium pullulans EXF-150]|uniref:Uncharacterized protein n=1 Tax=Aureobasidium pullulans EXF-150 TaxID=1043002 RepID=A0A074Y3J8_AURPU|nr:uncharacterized protein M438DRAFT_91640 [Aureobasidium pullulans EXF-150]KEQ88757.1 hypothetical protein M438DRAFT_91640 [Aureobasidium pullulans EXF-150]